MSKVRLYGSTSGYVELAAPAVADDGTLTLPTAASGFGKILQVVRATDTVQRTTTSTSYVDANLSVTITPSSDTSRLIIVYTGYGQMNAGTQPDQRYSVIITDSTDTALSGAEGTQIGVSFGSVVSSVADAINIWGYVEPGSTSALTYKVRFKSAHASNTAVLVNANTTGQLYAFEVAA